MFNGETRLTGGDQPLNGLILIGKATLNVLEARGRHESPLLKKSDLTSVTSTSDLARKSRASVSSASGQYIQRLDPGDSHAPPVVMQCMINICVAQYLIYRSRPCRDHVQRVRKSSINYRSSRREKQSFWF